MAPLRAISRGSIMGRFLRNFDRRAGRQRGSPDYHRATAADRRQRSRKHGPSEPPACYNPPHPAPVPERSRQPWPKTTTRFSTAPTSSRVSITPPTPRATSTTATCGRAGGCSHPTCRRCRSANRIRAASSTSTTSVANSATIPSTACAMNCGAGRRRLRRLELHGSPGLLLRR